MKNITFYDFMRNACVIEECSSYNKYMKYIGNHRLQIPAVGLGTTQFWSGNTKRAESVMQECMEQYGNIVVDTAEMYGYGRCETVCGNVLRKTGRQHCYLVGKILPEHVHHHEFENRLDATLQRLGTDYLDLYLLHWRQDANLYVLVEEMEAMKKKGKINHWGVSNFDVKDMKDLLKVKGGENCAVNQIFYNLYTRGADFDLIPLLKQHDILTMSYSTLGSRYTDSSCVTKNRHVQEICQKHGITPYALMLAFNMHQGISSLFSTSSYDHLQENMECLNDEIAEDLEILNRLFPSPDHAVPLAKL